MIQVHWGIGDKLVKVAASLDEGFHLLDDFLNPDPGGHLTMA